MYVQKVQQDIFSNSYPILVMCEFIYYLTKNFLTI